MRCSVLVLAVVAACWAVVEATPITLAVAPAIVALGIIGLKAALFAGVASRLGKRSLPQGGDVNENLLLTTVTQLDPDGCILKLLCGLQAKEKQALSPQEAMLASMFSNDTESLTSYNAAFVYAAGVGRQTRDPASCDKLFSKCPLEQEQLGSVLERAWGCGMMDLS